MTAQFDCVERLMRERRSERQFLPDAVPSDLMDHLLEVAACAPSASNRQPYRFMVVTRRETIDRMVATTERALAHPRRIERAELGPDVDAYCRNFLAFGQAPVVVVVFFRAHDHLAQAVTQSDPNDAVATFREALSSASAFIMQFLLAAHAMDLGACWMTGACVAEGELLELLEAPPGLRIAALIAVGRCATRSTAPRKRRLEQLRLAEPPDLPSVRDHAPDSHLPDGR